MYFPPEKNGYEKEDVHFTTPDGEKLLGWYFKADPKFLAKNGTPKGTIVQFHGNAENISSHYASLVWLTREGYNLFVFDYRGYGGSTGVPTQKGTVTDGIQALWRGLDFHHKSKSKLFIVFGQSLGGAVAAKAVEDFSARDQIDLMVLDSTFMSYKDVAQGVLARHWVTWIFSPLARVLISDEYSSEGAVKKFQPRLLVLHDEKDPVVPFDNGQEIFETAVCEKDFWKLNKSRHIGAFATDTYENRTKFLAYLETIMLKPKHVTKNY